MSKKDKESLYREIAPETDHLKKYHVTMTKEKCI